MIRLISITISAFVNSWVAFHKRLNIRLQFFEKLLTPFTIMMAEYKVWRDAANTKARVTGETMSLEWYLNLLFDPIGQGISIDTAAPSGVPAGIESSEVGIYLVAGDISSETGTYYTTVGMPGEGFLYGTASFVVYVPVALTAQLEAIAQIVRVYKLGGRSFKIVLV